MTIQRIKELAYDNVAKKFLARDPSGKKIAVPLGGASAGVGDWASFLKSRFTDPIVIPDNSIGYIDWGEPYISGDSIAWDEAEPTEISLATGVYAFQLDNARWSVRTVSRWVTLTRSDGPWDVYDNANTTIAGFLDSGATNESVGGLNIERGFPSHPILPVVAGTYKMQAVVTGASNFLSADMLIVRLA